MSEVCTGVDDSNNALTMMDLTRAPVTLVTKLLEVFVMVNVSFYPSWSQQVYCMYHQLGNYANPRQM